MLSVAKMGTFLAYIKFEARKGKPLERAGRKANDLKEETPMVAGLPKASESYGHWFVLSVPQKLVRRQRI